MRRAIEGVYEIFGFLWEGAMREAAEVSRVIGEFLEEMSATGRKPSSVASYAASWRPFGDVRRIRRDVVWPCGR
jgi:hypothetical protein